MTILITPPDGNRGWIYRMWDNTVKFTETKTAQQFIEEYGNVLEKDLMDRLRNGVYTGGPAQRESPTFTWREVYPNSFYYNVYGYHGEAKTRTAVWLDNFQFRHYGFNCSHLSDYRQPFYMERACRVIPARKFAGLNAYELRELWFMKPKGPSVRYSVEIVEFLTRTWNYQGKYHMYLWALIQAGLKESFQIIKKEPIRMSARPRIKR